MLNCFIALTRIQYQISQLQCRVTALPSEIQEFNSAQCPVICKDLAPLLPVRLTTQSSSLIPQSGNNEY